MSEFIEIIHVVCMIMVVAQLTQIMIDRLRK